MRYHGVKYIPKEVLQYINKMEDDRIDLSHFEDFLTHYFSKLYNDNYINNLINTHEHNNFKLFKMLLKSITIMDDKHNYRRLYF